MARYDPPQRYSYRAKDWEGWIEDYSRFRRATKLHKEDGDVQRDSLLYSMGTQQAVQILKTFRWEEEEEDTDYDLLVKKFSEYFLPKRNLIHDRSLFNSRVQNSGETVEEFVRALQSLVVHCHYADTEDQVRDRLVIGLRDQRLKEKLQLQNDLTLERVITMARQQKQLKEQMKEQSQKLEKLDIDGASHRRDQSAGASRGRARGRGGHRPKRHDSPSVVRNKDSCTKCGFEHQDKKCPAVG
ncbi:hypothetical protein V1264_020913 [Littorina saxatilis]|uniref:Retrotransposon gag domain-containing protein n=1 Tax=Littorina saxatilis TaxID=31220 RepID=A0AAN9BC45_9CAEN